ncbi:DUF2087 domain-containing protein [Lysinibacillus sp. FSL H8-0500]|uniref:Transcriptional regulator n=1 Tax=Lysinibacillus macroides TaxID=33935 RepID=A0A0M9DKY0_9BACI|nr:DUF2087 domain-containing protein [Lysinibacillus macroides]KOY82999.1 transcriptional regulator [Lysinibacillus macroides]QPR70152.1 DUF2087 domain-containing protein [Lysinibacillus macroides]
MDVNEQFWQASSEDIKKGYMDEHTHFTCLLCGEKIEKGIIYPYEGLLYEAEKMMQLHITAAHQSVFHYLNGLNKKITGLTEHQSHILRLFYEGKSDQEIQAELAIGSAATIRHHRFALKEKERQAKTLLVMMELLKEQNQKEDHFVPIHKTATMVDDRYNITIEEEQQLLEKFFPDGLDKELVRFPKREKQKIVVLRAITKLFEEGKHYTEKELNAVIEPIYEDYVHIRRYLIEYGFMDRTADGSAYWVKK